MHTGKMPHLLELFSGTHSVGTVAEREFGFDVESVDNVDRFEPTHVIDILRLRYQDLKRVPDFVWASPPCTTYSFAARWYRHRNPKNASPLTEAAHEAAVLLERAVEVREHAHAAHLRDLLTERAADVIV